MPPSSQHKISIPDLFRSDTQLASPSGIYFELQKIVDDPGKSLADAAFIIEKDPALSLRLLKIVNSAFYCFPNKIASIGQAATLIGTTELQNITLSTIFIDKFSDLPNDLLSIHDYWARSLRCALIAKEIDAFLGKEYADCVFICGLLHNIGQLVFFRRMPELARQVTQVLYALEIPSTEQEISIETRIIGFDHFQTGAALTKLWNLPASVSESIRLHAYPDNTDTYQKIASIIRLADCYSKIDLDCDGIVVNSLGISADIMTVLIDKAYDEFEEIFKVFYHKKN